MANSRIFDIIFRTKGLKKGKDGAEELDSSFNDLARTAKVAAIGFLSMQTALKAIEMAKMAANAETVKRSFQNLAKEPDKLLASMKKATAGTISEMELMQKFNEASLLGLPLERFDEMLNIARGAAQATGQSMDFMLSSITTGLGRQSKLMLDNLGIMIDIKQANEDYALSIGKVANSLTEQERKIAFVNAALNDGNKNLELMGGITEASINSFTGLNATFQNLQVSIGEQLLPVLVPLLDNINDFLKSIDPQRVVAYGAAITSLGVGFGIMRFSVMAANLSLKTFKATLISSGVGIAIVGLGELIRVLMKLKESNNQAAEEQKSLTDKLQESLKVQYEELGVLDDKHAKLNLISVADAKRAESIQNAMEAKKADIAKTIEELQIIGKVLSKKFELLDVNHKDFELRSNTLSLQERAINQFTAEEEIYTKHVQTLTAQIALKEKEKALNARLISQHPELAKKIGITAKATADSNSGLQNTIDLSVPLSNALSAAFDPNQGSGVAFQGFIMNVITALQGVILASGNVAQALTTTFVPGFGVAGAIAAIIGLEAAKAGVRSIKFAANGMDEMVNKPTLIMAGEAGPERVNITPTGRPSSKQNGEGMTINFNGPVTDREFIRDTILPEIDRVQRLGLA